MRKQQYFHTYSAAEHKWRTYFFDGIDWFIFYHTNHLVKGMR